jgi:hypothetical protein
MVPNSGAPLLSSFPPAMRLISHVLLRLTPEFPQPRSIHACHYAMLEKPSEVAAVINAIAPLG